MKKLLTSLAILAIAATTQAASMSWTVSGIKTPGDSTVSGSAGWLAYLFSTADTDAATISAALATSDFSVLDDAFDSTTTAKGKLSATSDASFNPGQSFEGFAVILDSTATSSAQNFIVTGLQKQTVNDAGSDITLAFGSQANATWNTIGQAPGPGPQPDVPEPATGALALAGVALLFRRRRA